MSPPNLDDVPLEALFPFLETLSLARYGLVSVATRDRLSVAFYAWDNAIIRDFAVQPVPFTGNGGSFRVNTARTAVARAAWMAHLARLEGGEGRRGRFAKAVALRGVVSRATLAVRALGSLGAAVLEFAPLSAPPDFSAVDAFEAALCVRLPAAARALLAATGGQEYPDEIFNFTTSMAGLCGGIDVYENQTSTALLPGGLVGALDATKILRNRRNVPLTVVALTGVRAGACILLDCCGVSQARPRGALYALTRAAGVALPAAAGARAADAADCSSRDEGPLEDALLDWLEARVAALRVSNATASAAQDGDRALYLPAWPEPKGIRSGLGGGQTVTRGVRIGVGSVLIAELGGVPLRYAAPFTVGLEAVEKATDWRALFPALRNNSSWPGGAAGVFYEAAPSSLRWGSKSLVFSYRLRIERGEEEERGGGGGGGGGVGCRPEPLCADSHDARMALWSRRQRTTAVCHWRRCHRTASTIRGPIFCGVFCAASVAAFRICVAY